MKKKGLSFSRVIFNSSRNSIIEIIDFFFLSKTEARPISLPMQLTFRSTEFFFTRALRNTHFLVIVNESSNIPISIIFESLVQTFYLLVWPDFIIPTIVLYLHLAQYIDIKIIKILIQIDMIKSSHCLMINVLPMFLLAKYYVLKSH